MDNRFIFLYPALTELWGRRCKIRAGRGKPGARIRVGHMANPVTESFYLMRSEKKVAKSKEHLPRKAAIA